MQIERLLKIVFLLMNATCGTTKQLAEQCSVSVRTIQRDIDALSLAGIPVYSSRGYGGGVGLLKEFTLDKTFMTEKEQADILHGLQALEGAGYPEIQESFQKFAAIFRRNAADRWLRVDFSSWLDSGVGKDKFERLKKAILTKKVIHFTYYSSENRISERIAEPLCLLFRERAWYLCVFDKNMNMEITLRVSRMRNVQVTQETFERTMEQDPMETPDYNRSYNLQRIVLRVTGNYAAKIFDEFPENVICPQSDGSFIIDQALPVNEWLTSYLLSFADGVEIIEPQSLRDMMREKISLMLEKYDTRPTGSRPYQRTGECP